jgi:hypothetical protein
MVPSILLTEIRKLELFDFELHPEMQLRAIKILADERPHLGLAGNSLAAGNKPVKASCYTISEPLNK